MNAVSRASRHDNGTSVREREIERLIQVARRLDNENLKEVRQAAEFFYECERADGRLRAAASTRAA